MMRTTFFLCLIFVALAALPAKAASKSDFTGHELLSMCRSTYDTDYGYCAGYVTAVANTLLYQDVAGRRACNHAPVKSQQLIDIYGSYAELFPEMLNQDANIVVAAAIERAFPCAK